MQPFRASLMGLAEAGRQVLEALLASPEIELVAVADRNAELLAGVLNEHRLAGYDDYRSLVVEPRADVVFVTTPPYAANEHIKLAAGRGLHVWRLAPVARSFEQASALVQAFQRAGTILRIGTRWRLAPAYTTLMTRRHELGNVFLARVAMITALPHELGWRGDSARAGGGVLLNHAFEAVDAVLWFLGLPDDVVATCSYVARAQNTQSYDTEDTAVVLLRYARASAVITASWLSGPAEQSFKLYGSQGSATIQSGELVLHDAGGATQVISPTLPANPFQAEVQAMVRAVSTGQPPEPATIRQQLQTVAVIEAAYLSARTGQPESPAALLRLHGCDLSGAGGMDRAIESAPPTPAD
ncbi:MAG: Gfo/Idh/MocA family protein [Phycisphaerae bacterium]